jgi:hypothetical protein
MQIRTPLPKLTKYTVITLIVCLAILVIIPISHTNFFSNTRAFTWKEATSNTPSSLFKKVLSVKTMRQIDEKLIRVMQIPSSEEKNFYVFDFRSPQLCGSKGCLYQIYDQSGHQHLELIANPNLPPSEKLIQVSNTSNQGFPCLIITQATTTENLVSRSLYCYRDSTYVQLNQALTNVGANFSWSSAR